MVVIKLLLNKHYTPKVEAAPTKQKFLKATTDATSEEDILLQEKEKQKKGRSPTIITGVTGATGGLTLGKKVY